jgi:hypothetical protein
MRARGRLNRNVTGKYGGTGSEYKYCNENKCTKGVPARGNEKKYFHREEFEGSKARN